MLGQVSSFLRGKMKTSRGGREEENYDKHAVTRNNKGCAGDASARRGNGGRRGNWWHLLSRNFGPSPSSRRAKSLNNQLMSLKGNLPTMHIFRVLGSAPPLPVDCHRKIPPRISILELLVSTNQLFLPPSHRSGNVPLERMFRRLELIALLESPA